MDKGLRILLGLFLVLAALLILLQSTAPKPVNWEPVYNTKQKLPLGLFVLNQEIDSIFPDAFVERWDQTIYEYFRALEAESDTPDAILLVNEKVLLDNQSIEKLLNWVSGGKTVLLSGHNFPQKLLDTLQLKVRSDYISDSIELSLHRVYSDAPVIQEGYPFGRSWFERDTSTRFEILGEVCNDEGINHPNFINITYGKGNIFLHSEPAVFSNYALLKADYYLQAQYILSFLNQPHILWSLKGQTISEISDSPLRYIRSQPPLRLAWNLLISGLIILMIFNAKRRQRPVPVMVQPVNSTEEFVKTISNLYQQEGSVRDIMDKKIKYTLERIRSRFFISTDKLDDEFTQRLHIKSGKSKKDIQRVVFLIQKHRDSDYICGHDDLVRLNKAIEQLF